MGTFAKGPALVSAGQQLSSFGWFGYGHAGTFCDNWCLIPKDRSNCSTATGSGPTLGFYLPLEGPYTGRKE